MNRALFFLKLRISNLQNDNAQKFEQIAVAIHGVERVDTWRGRAALTLADAGTAPAVIDALRREGFDVADPDAARAASVVSKVNIDGMTCRSCEIIVERDFKKIPGVRKVDVDAHAGIARIVCDEGSTPDIERLQEALGDEQYVVRSFVETKKQHRDTRDEKSERPSFGRLIGLFALVFAVGWLFSKIGLFRQSSQVAASIGFLTAVAIGLVAGTSSCLAVAGGLLLSTAAKYRERYGDAASIARITPVVLFVTGRVLSYGILGGVIGFVGTSLAPSPLVTGALTLVAAVYMLIMGLDMLHVAPASLKRLLPRMPKFLSRRIMDAEGKEHPAMPFLLGAATFFLPCGFTQSLQLYALTTGSFIASALTLAGFAIGTAPALLALGWASISLKGKAGKLFFQFSGAVVVVLGIWNIQNGLTIVGYPLSFPASANDGGMTVDGNTQVMNMIVDGGYQPSQFTIKAGMPTRWEVDGTKAAGCTSVLVSRQLGIEKLLAAGPNTIAFTAPQQPGTYQFSCSMGMYRGQITIISKS